MDERYELFCHLIDTFDNGCTLIEEYDSLSHNYNGVVMFQAEAQMIKMIGTYEGITSSEIAARFNKTLSACSQLVRKLKKKNWVFQKRNHDNNREYNLYLTEEGQDIFNKHKEFENNAYRRTFDSLKDFSDKDLLTYIEIQKKLNSSFALDVKESKELNCF